MVKNTGLMYHNVQGSSLAEVSGGVRKGIEHEKRLVLH